MQRILFQLVFFQMPSNLRKPLALMTFCNIGFTMLLNSEQEISIIFFFLNLSNFFFVCFLFSCIWFGIPENHQNNLIQAVSTTTLLLLNRTMLDLSDESIQNPGINENYIYNFHSEVQTFILYMNYKNICWTNMNKTTLYQALHT